MRNPFIYGKIAVGETFTNRESEQKRLFDNIGSHINSILISLMCEANRSSMLNSREKFFASPSQSGRSG
ncbi:MAG: hypothetical protein QME58_06315 [Bacteroidota bacterium]|nr:hypothetical protein [Bacteroidota bacterium]